MNLLRFSTLATLLVLASCSHPPPPTYFVGDVVPAGRRIEYYAQIHDGSWQRTLTQKAIPRDMPIQEAENWALSAAQQRLGNHWKDYCIRVIPPRRTQFPVMIWRRDTYAVERFAVQ